MKQTIGEHSPNRKGQKNMDAKNYDVKKIRMPITISNTSGNRGRNSHTMNPESIFSLTVHQGMEISNKIGEFLKKHNIFDFTRLHGYPDQISLEQMYAFALLHKSLGNLEEVAADNTTASLVCGKVSEKFFQDLNESGYQAVKCGSGIYRIKGYLFLDLYIMVIPELEEPEYRWMESLIRQAGGKCPEISVGRQECSFRTIEL